MNAWAAHRTHRAKGEGCIDVSGLGSGVHIWDKQVPVVQADLQHLISLNIRDVHQVLQAQDERLLVLRPLLHDTDVGLKRNDT